VSASKSPSEKVRPSRTPRLAGTARASHGRHSTVWNRGHENIQPAGAPADFPLKVNSPDRFDHREVVAGAPVWAWMARDCWWPAVILAPTRGLPFDRVTIRLAHGVSVTVPINFVVRREPTLDDREKPIRRLESPGVEAAPKFKRGPLSASPNIEPECEEPTARPV
jgi:hypothetical protein